MPHGSVTSHPPITLFANGSRSPNSKITSKGRRIHHQKTDGELTTKPGQKVDKYPYLAKYAHVALPLTASTLSPGPIRSVHVYQIVFPAFLDYLALFYRQFHHTNLPKTSNPMPRKPVKLTSQSEAPGLRGVMFTASTFQPKPRPPPISFCDSIKFSFRD